MRREAIAAVLGLFASGCVGPDGDGLPSDTDSPPDTDAADCVCDAPSTCCDGCAPQNLDLPCHEGQTDRYAQCDAVGACVSVGDLTALQIGEALWAHALAWAPDGAWLVVGAQDEIDGDQGTLALLDRDGTVLRRVDGPTAGVDVSPDGASVARCGDGLQVLDADTFDELATDDCARGAVAFSPDGAKLAFAVSSGVQVLSWPERDPLFSVEHGDADTRLWAIAWSPDGTHFASATGQAGFGSPRGSVRTWDGETGEAGPELSCTAMDVAWSADGDRLGAACWSAARIFDAATGDLQRDLAAPQPALSVAWSGDTLLVGAFQGGVTAYDADSGVALYRRGAGAGSGSPKDLALAPDGSLAGALWDHPGGAVWSPPDDP